MDRVVIDHFDPLSIRVVARCTISYCTQEFVQSKR